MKIYLGSDHAGYKLKETIRTFLIEKKYEVEDMGAHKYEPEDDYPDFVRPVAEAVSHDMESRGIIVGGSGQGEAMTANRTKGVRAAVFYGNLPAGGFEIVELSRKHNNANILSLGARFIDDELAKKAVKLWLETNFEGGRHERRIAKIDQ